MLDELTMDRRAWLGHAMMLIGATAAAGFSPEALAKAAKSPRRFLDAGRFKTLTAVADTILPVTDTPGALAAKVPQTLDALLANWASPQTRELVAGALFRIDELSRTRNGKPFAALKAAERTALLTGHDKAALQPVPPPPGAKAAHPFAPLVSVADNGYHRIKDLVISLYYSSEIGMTREIVYEHVPGAWVPSLKITPGMRPFAGTGPF